MADRPRRGPHPLCKRSCNHPTCDARGHDNGRARAQWPAHKLRVHRMQARRHKASPCTAPRTPRSCAVSWTAHASSASHLWANERRTELRLRLAQIQRCLFTCYSHLYIYIHVLIRSTRADPTDSGVFLVWYSHRWVALSTFCASLFLYFFTHTTVCLDSLPPPASTMGSVHTRARPSRIHPGSRQDSRMDCRIHAEVLLFIFGVARSCIYVRTLPG